MVLLKWSRLQPNHTFFSNARWLTEERAADYEEGMKALEKGIPLGMEKLAGAMVKAAKAEYARLALLSFLKALKTGV
jgi:hypothetical protein